MILREKDLGHIYGILVSNGIDELRLLARLKYSDFEKIGIVKGHDKVKLLEIITEYSKNNVQDEVKSYKKVSFDDKSSLLFSESSIITERSYSSGFFNDAKILVCVRKKPIEKNKNDALDIDENNIVVNEPKVKLDLQPYTEQHKFNFDVVFDENQTNDDIFHNCVKEISSHVLNGGIGSIIAYGQTGTGKTYTMMEHDHGMVYSVLKDITRIKSVGRISICEIYMGNVYDLLNNREKIFLREVNGVVHLKNSVSREFKSYSDVCGYIKDGLSYRKTGVTGANTKSSRSHAIIMVDFPDKKKDSDDGTYSLIFVDLAGSERGTDRQSNVGEIKNEGAEINKSLLALKECIRGIEIDKKHLPFRQSKLTQILKNSYVGQVKTCLIATISPSFENVEHTLNTLRYASRIKENKGNDKQNDTEKFLKETENVQQKENKFKMNNNLEKSKMIKEIDDVLSRIKTGAKRINNDKLKRVKSKLEEALRIMEM